MNNLISASLPIRGGGLHLNNASIGGIIDE